MTITWKTEVRRLTELKPYEFNPRTITKDDLEKLKQSITNSGYHAPILIDADNTIIAGHARWHAMKQLKVKTIDCRVPDRKLTEDEFKEINIRDNVNNGNWDVDVLANNFDVPSLIEWGVPENLFEGFQADSMSGTTGLTDDDAVPDVPVEPISKLGDLYALGNHRLLCGDSTNIEHVERLMGGEKADMVFTSPPYNGNTHIWTKEGDNKLYKNNKDDNKDSNSYIEFLNKVLKNAVGHTNGFIFWNVGYNANARSEYIKAIVPFLNMLWETIVWKKSSAMNLSSGLTRSFEFIFCFKTSDRRKHLGKVNVREDAHWEVNNNNANIKGEHHACFPVALPERGIILATEEGESVLDLFGGSGTTMIAAEKLGRKAYLMELDPRYCDLIIKRWEEFTGKKAELIK